MLLESCHKSKTHAVSPDHYFELGSLHCDRGDFMNAIVYLRKAAEGFGKMGKLKEYLKSISLLLRLYAETEDISRIKEIKMDLLELVSKEGFELSSRVYYTLSLCSGYNGQFPQAMEYAKKSLAMAISSDTKEDMCYAISAIAICYTNLGMYAEAQKEIENLQIFLQVMDMPEIRISAQILSGKILRDMGKPEQTLEILWQTYDYIKKIKALNRHIYLLFEIGRTYLAVGDKNLARTYLFMAHRLIDPKNMIRLSRVINETILGLGAESEQKYDIILKLEEHQVFEKKLGRIDFKNQFVLLDLLKLFVSQPGEVYSKEFLVENIWKQTYNPAVHDNKIYVTIKRLRKMIEPDCEKPKYIFRAKNGYYMNKIAKVSFEDRGSIL